MKKINKLKGFTLIELLVVLFIIGLLAALVIVNVSGNVKEARDKKRMSDLKTLKTALESYANKKGSYPKTFTGTNPNLAVTWYRLGCSDHGLCGMCSSYNTSGSFGLSGSNGWIPDLAPDFISVLPQDPKPLGSSGCYYYVSNGSDYMVVAHSTVETACDGSDADTITDPGDECNSTSFQEMDRRLSSAEENTIAVYSENASQW